MIVAPVLLLTAALLAAPAPPAKPPGPVALTPAEADSVRRAIEKSRGDEQEWLKSAPNSYLAATRRIEFLFSPYILIGGSDQNHVRLDDPAIRRNHLKVTVVGDSFRVESQHDSATVRIGEREVREATVGPSSLKLGRFTLRLSHQRYPAIIVFDPQSPRYAEYKGMEYYAVDPAYRFVLPLTKAAKRDTTILISTTGYQRRAEVAGWFDFAVRDTACRLEVHRLLEPGVGENDLAVFFRDATTGGATYPVGRYLDPVPLPDGRYLVDFNNAYNPACAFSPLYNCPIPPRRNRLKVAIHAGEKDPHYLKEVPRP